MRVGIIGLGMVGGNLRYALKYYHKTVYGFDINKPADSWAEMLMTDFTFICVPTQPGNDKRLDMSIVYNVLRDLENAEYQGVVIIKSTLGLKFIEDNALSNYKLNIVVFPEWLREQYAIQDTLVPDVTVIGCKDKKLVEIITKEVCPWHQWTEAIHIVSPEEAILIKLTANALASTKISFANQIHLICEKYHLNSQKIMDVIKTDPRCAPRYLDPGYPYGGHCLVKDTDDLTYAIESNELFKGVEKINEIIKGKAKNVND